MKIIEDWIDSKLTSLICADDGYIILTNEDVKELKVLLGIHPGIPSIVTEMAAKDYVYYLTDMHREYFLSKMEGFSNEYAQEQSDTEGVMQSCQ